MGFPGVFSRNALPPCLKVKAGTRTFRFEGDPQEYNLDGPVHAAMDGPTATRPSKRGGEAGGQANEEKKDSTTGRVVLTTLAALLCAGALWKCLTPRMKRAS